MYEYNSEAPNMINDPREWEHLSLQELFNVSNVLAKRYQICVSEYPTLAPQLLNGLRLIQSIINEKQFEGLDEDDI